MQVTISVGGRFHAFYLAQQLLKRGCLERLITSYPKFEVQKYGIPKEKVRSVLIKEILGRGWGKMPMALKAAWDPQYAINEIYDRCASRLYAKGGIGNRIFTAWSGFALNTLSKAKEAGAVTVLERGSAHMAFQNDILKEEYEMCGMRPLLAHPKSVEKELKEYEEADFISVPSLFAKRTFVEKGFTEEKLIHVPYGVDLDGFKAIPKEDNIFRIIHCGAITLQKGAHYLLQAFAELDLRNSELWLIGAMSEEIRPFLKKYGNGKVFHKGPYPQKELYKYYSQGSVFALMSVQEGLAMVQPQAMACGLPVICTTNTGGEDIVRDGIDGFIIPARDIEALKEKLVYFYEHPDIRGAMGQSAKERVSAGFTWDDYGERMVAAYRSALSKNTLK